MLFKCCATHVFRVIWDVEFDGDTHFLVWPEGRSTSGQTRSNLVKFQNSKFSYKNMPFFCRFVSEFKKCHLFLCTSLKMPKIAFQKCDVITSTWFFGHSTDKNKDIALTFCMRVICMYLDHICSGFWITWKFWIL